MNKVIGRREFLGQGAAGLVAAFIGADIGSKMPLYPRIPEVKLTFNPHRLQGILEAKQRLINQMVESGIVIPDYDFKKLQFETQLAINELSVRNTAERKGQPFKDLSKSILILSKNHSQGMPDLQTILTSLPAGKDNTKLIIAATDFEKTKDTARNNAIRLANHPDRSHH